MASTKCSLFAVAIAATTLAACTQVKTGDSKTSTQEMAAPTDPIASAMTAAPASVSKNATVVTVEADGSMKTLRKGTNGFTCMPDSPATPGPDPMCMDANAAEWAMAWIGKKAPPTDKPGIMYMLTGGTDASNTDPYATQPTKGDDWIKTGPHLMLVGSVAALKGYPSGASPDTGAPYVMWSGTPYAHLMVPVS